MAGGAVLAFLAVALGAFGAHALRDFLMGANRTGTYETAVHYHFFHAIALIITGIMAKLFPNKAFSVVAILFASGTLIFSGSLYLICASGITWPGALAPLGGLAFLSGWALLARQAYLLK